ncbi:hypothetical protein N806_09980 [Rhodococcus sp. P27]|nr:hypothetical protein N806_09980 [Rhodococcus sp. P27]
MLHVLAKGEEWRIKATYPGDLVKRIVNEPASPGTEDHASMHESW